MPMQSGEHRVVRREHDGQLYQWSNAKERPSGGGWDKVNKSKHPKASSYTWIRSASYIRSDHNRLLKAQQDMPAPSFPATISKFFSPTQYLASYHDYMQRKTSGTKAVGDRVEFGGSVYYVKQLNNMDGGVTIKNAITGEEKSVNNEEISAAKPNGVIYPKTSVVKIAKGVVDKRKELTATVMDYKNGKYQVSIDGGKTSFAVYPEAINAVVANDESTEVLDEKLLSHRSLLTDPGQQRIVRILNNASHRGQTSVTLEEVRQQLQAEGHPMADSYIINAFADIGSLQPNIQFNQATGTLGIEGGKKSLEHIAKFRHITPDNSQPTKNLTSNSPVEMYGYVGQQVKGKDASVEGGTIDKIAGKDVYVRGSNGKLVKTIMDNLSDALSRRNLLPNPANPETFGNIRHKDVWWTLRDREHCQDMRPGEMVTFLPGLSKLSGKKSNVDKVKARVVEANKDGTVTLDMDTGDGKTTRVNASPRQLALNRRFDNVDQLHDWIKIRPSQTYNHSFFVGTTRVDIGDSGRRGDDAKKRVDIVFANGKELVEAEQQYCRSMPHSSGRGFLPMLSMTPPDPTWTERMFGRAHETTGPSNFVADIIRRLYPNTKKIAIARDTTTPLQGDMRDVQTEIKLSFVLDPKDYRGVEIDWDRVLEGMSGHAGKPGAIRASDIPQYNSIRMSADENNLYVTLGDRFKQYLSDLPPLTIKSEEKKIFNKYGHVASVIPLPDEKNSANFASVVGSTDYLKRLRWNDEVDADNLVKDSSVFTYDRMNDRYVVDRSNYKEAKRFMRRFFGEHSEDATFETFDGGYYYKSAENKLLDEASAAEKAKLDAIKNDISVIKELTPKMGFHADLRSYQNAAVHFADSRYSSLLALDQGTGKTMTAAATAVLRLNQLEEFDLGAGIPKKRKVLVIAPASVAKTSWMGDLEKALNGKNGKGKYAHTLLMGEGRLESYKALADEKSNVHIGVTSYDTFRQDFQELKNMDFDMAILDEAQSIKNDVGGDEKAAAVTSQRVKNMLEEVRYKVALTGTPMENKPSDLQSILEFLNPEIFGSEEKFNRDFIETDFIETHDIHGRKQKRAVGVSLKNVTALRTKLDQVMFRVTKEQLKAPDSKLSGGKVVGMDGFRRLAAQYNAPGTSDETKKAIGDYQVVPNRKHNLSLPEGKEGSGVTLNRKENKLQYSGSSQPLTMDGFPEYFRMITLAKQRLKEQVQEAAKTGGDVNYQTLLIRMQQAINDPSLLAKSMGPEFNVSVPNPKVEKMMEILNTNLPGANLSDSEHGKVIIFAKNLETINFLQKQIEGRYPMLKSRITRFTGAGDKGYEKDKRKIENDFNTKDTATIMLANDAAKTGVNLPAASTVINYDADWNPQDINQRIDRAHRVRSIKDILSSRMAPPRDVEAHTLAVVDSSGNINATIESKKLANRIYKEQMFKTIINGEDSEPAKMMADNAQKMAEELLDVANTEGISRVDAGEQRRYAAEKTRAGQRRRQAERQYGSYVANRYFT